MKVWSLFGPSTHGGEGELGQRYNFNTVAAVVCILMSGVLYVIIPSQIDTPLIVLGASQASLSPELFPQMMAVSFLGLGIWLFFKSFAIEQRNELRDLDREAIINVTVTLVVMALYVVLMVHLGFVVGSAIMIALLSTFFGNRNFVLGILVSIFVPMALFFTFRWVLKTELPPFPIDIYPLTHWSLI
ncbi:MAG: tripartite tricarboxylate transporter TctB family protein [Candidatus Tectomicrobia bacterium]